ncbi:MAG: hypothetical protein ACXVXI_03190, partial [Mycobacteriaceae bacterium]
MAWVRDPSQLPQGWRIDPATGELSPPPLAMVGAAKEYLNDRLRSALLVSHGAALRLVAAHL